MLNPQEHIIIAMHHLKQAEMEIVELEYRDSKHQIHDMVTNLKRLTDQLN